MCRDIRVWLPRNGQYHCMITTTKTTCDILALLYDELMSDKLDGDPLKILWKVSGVLSASVDRLQIEYRSCLWEMSVESTLKKRYLRVN